MNESYHAQKHWLLLYCLCLPAVNELLHMECQVPTLQVF